MWYIGSGCGSTEVCGDEDVVVQRGGDKHVVLGGRMWCKWPGFGGTEVW